MPIWTFFGQLQPQYFSLSLPDPMEGEGESGILSESYKFRIIVHNSQLIVDLNVSQKDAENVDTLRNIAISHIQVISNLIGYHEGAAINVEITSGICRETDNWVVFGCKIPVLEKTRPERTTEISSDLLIAVAYSPTMQLVLTDFREAMLMPEGTGFFCYRAVEAMMQSMKSSDTDKDLHAWELLRSNLQIDRSAIEKIKKHADFPRHGRPLLISDGERAAIFTITDEIIRRFHTHSLRRVALNADEFPLLKA